MDYTEIILGSLTLIGVFITSYFSLIGKREASQTNQAVNKNKEGEPRLYDMVKTSYLTSVENRKMLIDLNTWKENHDKLHEKLKILIHDSKGSQD